MNALSKKVTYINEEMDIRVIDTPQFYIVQTYILFDNSYNYEQSYQWIEVGRSKTLADAEKMYRSECDKRSKL